MRLNLFSDYLEVQKYAPDMGFAILHGEPMRRLISGIYSSRGTSTPGTSLTFMNAGYSLPTSRGILRDSWILV